MTIPSPTGAKQQDNMLRELVRTDPVASLLLARWRVPYPVLAGICFGLLVLLLVIFPMRWPRVAPGTALPEPEAFFDTLGGAMMIVAWLVFVPVVWGFYAWQPAAIVRLHARLQEALSGAGAEAKVELTNSPTPGRGSSTPPWPSGPVLSFSRV
jgi:hypothetical protein